MEDIYNDFDSKLKKSSASSVRDNQFLLEYLETVIRIREEEWEDNTTVRGYNQREMDNMMSDFIKTRLARSFQILEGVADKFVRSEYREGVKYSFPEIKRTLAVYKGRNGGKEDKAELDYFAELGKVWDGKSEAVRTEAYNTTQKCLELERNTWLKGRFPMEIIRTCLIYGLLVLFMAGSFAPHIPDFVGMWLEGEHGSGVNIACIAVLVLGSFWQLGTQDEHRGLSGLIEKLSMLHVLGSIVVGLIMLGGYPDRVEPLYLEILGLYSLLASFCGIIDGFANKIKAAFRREKSRKEFARVWEQERKYLDHYITFHSQWWANQRDYEAEPGCLKTMRARYEILETAYRKLS